MLMLSFLTNQGKIMIGAANIVHDIVGVRNGAQQRGAVWTIFSGIHKVHRMWRLYRTLGFFVVNLG